MYCNMDEAYKHKAKWKKLYKRSHILFHLDETSWTEKSPETVYVFDMTCVKDRLECCLVDMWFLLMLLKYPGNICWCDGIAL